MKLAPAIACCLLIAPSGAWAADFTFDVPVRIENAPSMTDAYVKCTVRAYAVGAVHSGAGTGFLGQQEVRVPVTGGRYDGTVTVEVNNTSIFPSSDARSYVCTARAVGASRTGSIYSAMPGNFRSVYETATGQALERLVNMVEANLP